MSGRVFFALAICVYLCSGWANAQLSASSLRQRERAKMMEQPSEKLMQEGITELHILPKKPPQPKTYVATGFIKLLFDNVSEPFMIYYDGENHRSRIDYGTGNVRTLQLGGRANRLYHIEYPSVGHSERPTCIELKGTRDSRVHAQKAVPLLDNFEHAGSEQLGKITVDRWKREMIEEGKPNKHTFSLLTDKNSGKPLKLEVFSQNTKSGQVVDRYEIDYKNFYVTRPTDDVFQVPKDVQCRSSVGTDIEEEEFMGGLRRKVRQAEEQGGNVDIERELLFVNPIAGLVVPEEHLRYQRELDKIFNEYNRHFNKNYQSQDELNLRRTAFCHNFRYINLVNRGGLPFKLRINHLADRTNDELRKLLGVKRTGIPETAHGKKFDMKMHNFRGIRRIPNELDWRSEGAVSQVYSQKNDCGSDWAIAATSVVESAHFLRTNKLIKLSPQELLDCSHEEGTHDCQGGDEFRAYEYIVKNGLASETGYGPLLNRRDQCRRDTGASAKIKSWVLVPANDEYDLKRAVAMNGPVAVSLDANHKSFFFYGSGIYREPNCKSSMNDVNHAVVIVGYGQMNGRDFFIIKNSYGTDWGQGGYMLIESAMNHCGILTTPTFVVNE